ncbi:hypothetical protein DFH29DRAFT_365347 [Suillus ampliporus]|nr:hypothetical protein DFH29DRAFT_365347 [Suillus ampliporus]
MNSNPILITAAFLYLSSFAYAQNNNQYTYWGGRIAGIVIAGLTVLILAACCFSLRGRRSSRNFTRPNLPVTNAQPGQPSSLPSWQGLQMYAPPPRPPPGLSNTASMNPYDYNANPGSQPAPPPYVKEEGVIVPQDSHYASPPGPPPPAHMR